VVATLAAFMNSELSAFYFDIRKDTLYCDPPSSVARKAALTAIDIICDAILRWLAPVLSFTCEEAWRMYKPNAEASVHLTLFPEGFDQFRDDVLAAKWETIRDVRRVVTGALEIERAAKNIGSSLEASPLVYVSDKNIFSTLFDVDLAEVCITSNAMVTNDDAPASAFTLADVPGVAVVVEKAVGTKCARSWKILPTVGEDPEYPDVSPRDAQALREWKVPGRKPVVEPAAQERDVAEKPEMLAKVADFETVAETIEPLAEPNKPAAPKMSKRVSAADVAEPVGSTDVTEPPKAAKARKPAAKAAKGKKTTGTSSAAKDKKAAGASKTKAKKAAGTSKPAKVKKAGSNSKASKDKKAASASKAAKSTKAAKGRKASVAKNAAKRKKKAAKRRTAAAPAKGKKAKAKGKKGR
jgi:isoleucyl-tRNA synthetase